MPNHIPIIGFTGRAGSGKDTAADYLATQGYSKYAFAKPIKDMLTALGFPESEFSDREKKEAALSPFGVSYRTMAQTLGTEWGRSLNPDFWLLCATQNYNNARKSGQYKGFVVSDVRFENEAAWVRKHGVLIHVIGRRSELGKEESKHVSEAGVQLANADLILNNVSTIEYLHNRLEEVLKEVIHG